METSLHRHLKEHYAASAADVEVSLGGFRVDAVRDGELIEIQCASLSAIRDKARQLLARHPLRVVKPVIVRTRIHRLSAPGGKTLSRRLSPKRGHLLDLFEELIHFTRLFPHPNLVLDVPLVRVEQFRVPRRGRRRRWHPDYRVHDVRLEEIIERHEVRTAGELFTLTGLSPATAEFDTADLARQLDRPRWFAQKVAYVLRETGVFRAAGRKRTGIRYRHASAA